MSSSLSELEKMVIETDFLTREDIVTLNDGKAITEKGLVLHGCKPSVRLLMQAAQTHTKLTLTINRQKGEVERDSKIDRYIIELKKSSDNESFGIIPTVDQDYIFVEKVSGIAAEAGVKEKDHIKRINGEPIQSLEDFENHIKGQEKIVLYISRGLKISRKKVEFEKKIVNLHIPYESGDILGITVKDLTVIKIQDGSIAETKFELEDKLIDINGAKLKEDEQLYDLLRRINEDLEINVMRNVVKKEDIGERADTSSSVTNVIYRVLISLSMASCEALGVRPDENLMISRIMDKSHAQGKFELGDVIKKLNGIPIKDRNQFFKLFENATAEGRIIVERSAERELELEKRLLPPNIEKIIKRRAGFDYIIVNVRYDSSAGRPFGLNIANVTAHKIIVPEITENTVAGDYFKICDHIIAINGNPVSDVIVAKKMIRECGANFQAVIERPVTLDSNQGIKREVDEWRRRMTRPVNLEQMPPDVQEIIEKHFKQREAKQVTNLISVLRKPTGEQRKTHFSEHHIETQIQSDIPATKRLRSCR
ncbi:PDZ/DHR/GLGF domain protein [Onchocerca flexuosa]|uniref:PDZ/DHR/GLGF domain protein n=1 Tax=Onchocerca flexuosa TaxID=387005 RepID=A0A238C1D8_9BILA|nr:PDZ/DHR/GLGF domain protein [Onchocerca flexuosa]